MAKFLSPQGARSKRHYAIFLLGWRTVSVPARGAKQKIFMISKKQMYTSFCPRKGREAKDKARASLCRRFSKFLSPQGARRKRRKATA